MVGRKLVLASSLVLVALSLHQVQEVNAEEIHAEIEIEPDPSLTESSSASVDSESTVYEKPSSYEEPGSSSDELIEVADSNPPPSRQGVNRISGQNRFKNAAEISKTGWDQAETVLITNGNIFTDALTGTPLSSSYDAPLLLSHGDRLADPAKEEIQRLGAKNVVILGGKTSFSENAEQSIADLGVRVKRIGGNNRYHQAGLVAKEVMKQKEKELGQALKHDIFLVNGNEFADALSVAPIAAEQKAPIFLTRSDQLNPNVTRVLDQVAKVYLVGGKQSISQKVEDELADYGLDIHRFEGRNRYEVNIKVLEYFGVKDGDVFVANGEIFSDGLPVASLAAKENKSLLLIKDNHDINIDSRLNYIYEKKNKVNYTIFGGLKTISSYTENRLTGLQEKFLPISFASLDVSVDPTPIRVEKEIIPFSVQFKENSSLLVGQRIARQAGRDGAIETSVYSGEGVSESAEREVKRRIAPVHQFVEYGSLDPKTGRQSTLSDATLIVLSFPDEEQYHLSKSDEEFQKVKSFVLPENSFLVKDFPKKDLVALDRHLDPDKLNQEFDNLVNKLRKEKGVSPLIFDGRFSAGTQEISEDLGNYGYIAPHGQKSHTLTNGKETDTVFEKYGLANITGENSAYLYVSNNPFQIVSEKYLAEQFFDLWFNSPGHHAAMTSKIYTGYNFDARVTTNGQTKIGTKDSNGNYQVRPSEHFVGVYAVTTLSL